MNYSLLNKVPLLLAVSAAVVGCCAWLTLLVSPGPGGSTANLVLGASLVVGLLSGLLAVREHIRHEVRAIHFFDSLCQMDPYQNPDDWSAHSLPVLSRAHPLSRVAYRTLESFAELTARARSAEHSRTAQEVRIQRTRDDAEHYRVMLDGLREPIVAIDRFDEVVYANLAAQQLLGFAIDEAESHNLQELIPCEAVSGALIDTRRRKAPTQRLSEAEIVTADGQRQTFRLTTVPLSADVNESADSDPHGAVVVLRDIGEEKVAQRRNAEFISSVSHEMKTPLAGIKAYVELLVDGDAEDEAAREEFLEVINGQTDRMQRLIDNLLNLARIEAGVVEVSKQPRSINEVLEEAFSVVQPSAESKSIDLTADLSPLYLGVLADRDMILQSAINLLSNAIKYTAPNGSVCLRSRMHGNEVEFEVEDSGVGLSEEDCEKVFDKFYRVHKDRTMAQGTGLGLPLAKHIVEDVHGGRMCVESVPGEGSTFRVTLPAADQLTQTETFA